MKLHLSILYLFISGIVFSQSPSSPAIHSHNDYHHDAPFWMAYNAGASSIEVDVLLKDGILYVAHDEEEISADKTIERLYLDPLQKLRSIGTSIGHIQLLVDFKTEAYSTLKKLLEITDNYPGLFKSGSNAIPLIISGNRPKQSDYINYPEYIFFDGRSPKEVLEKGSEKIGLISRNIHDFTRWRGHGEFAKADSLALANFISDCHSNGKKVRFWASKDNEQVYQMLLILGVDYINTDRPFGLRKYLDNQKSK